MIIKVVEFRARAGFERELAEKTAELATHTVRESGVSRFDFVQAVGDPLQFFIYETYESDDVIAAHKRTPHYQKWVSEAEPLMAGPRKTTVCKNMP